MAQKRMFDKAIIDTDRFMDLPMSAKAVYFLMGMEADDEGFVSPKKVLRVHGGNEDDVRVLIAKKFLIPFESGVVVITDWNKNNWLDARRIRPTEYKKERDLLLINKDRSYSLSNGLATAKPEEYRIEEKSNPETKVSFPLVEKLNIYSAEPLRVTTADEDEPRKAKPAKKDYAEYMAIAERFARLAELSTGVVPDLSKSYFILKRAKEKSNVTDFDALFKYFFADDRLSPEQHISLAFVCSPAYIKKWEVSKKKHRASQVEAASEIRL